MNIEYDDLDKSLAKHYYKFMSDGFQAHINSLDDDNNVEIKIRKNCPSCPLNIQLLTDWLFKELKKDCPEISSLNIII